MTTSVKEGEIEQRVLELLVSIAPDIDPATVDPTLELRDQFDFDSMDRLHFVAAISEAFHIEIPEQDYAALASVQGCREYIAKRVSAS